MTFARPMPPLVLSDKEIQQLQGIANSRSYPHSLVHSALPVAGPGKGKVDGEWHLIATMHNLLKLFRYRRSQQQALVMGTG